MKFYSSSQEAVIWGTVQFVVCRYIGNKNSIWNSCCCKQICNGCNHANKRREIEGRLQHKCPFCRTDLPKTEEQINEQVMRRVEANDPAALRRMGTTRYYEGDYKSAYEYRSRAAALGDILAHYQLSVMHRLGKGVEKDEKGEVHHAEKAAIGGHPIARHNLGCLERRSGRMNRAAKHWIIAAKLGYGDSLKGVKMLYEEGYVSKEDFAAALRGHQAAIDATKSPQREEATIFYEAIDPSRISGNFN